MRTVRYSRFQVDLQVAPEVLLSLALLAFRRPGVRCFPYSDPTAEEDRPRGREVPRYAKLTHGSVGSSPELGNLLIRALHVLEEQYRAGVVGESA